MAYINELYEIQNLNFEKLKFLLSTELIEKEDDRFYFNWAGKSNLDKLIQSPAYGTLKPDEDKSVDFDNTENIVIVGENLETLKLLLKPYFGKVKMIYIDPPYNTGKDFIYRDNFKEPLKDYLEKTGQIDSEGKKLTTNTEASGRYHSDWLNFVYPRLFLARSLLRDDGEDVEELKKKYLKWLGIFADQPLVSGWQKIDIIYEVMLKEGLNLNSKIEKIKIKNDEFYYVKDEIQNLDFYITFKDQFSHETIEEIRTTKYKGKMFVFLDNSLTDSDKINLSAFVRLNVI